MHQTIEDWCSDLVSLVDDARASEHFQDWLEGQSRFYGKFEAKASPFTAGMNPTKGPQPSELSPLDSVSMVKHNGQKLAVGLGSARTTKATTPFPRGRLRGCGDTADKKRPSPACACPPWHEGQAGRWHGPCPDAGKPATGGIPAVSPRRTGCTVQADTASERTPNTPHPSRGRRIAHEPGIAWPDPVRQARSCQRGHGTGPLSHAEILAF